MHDIDFLIAAMLFSLLYPLEEKIGTRRKRRYEKSTLKMFTIVFLPLLYEFGLHTI